MYRWTLLHHPWMQAVQDKVATSNKTSCPDNHIRRFPCIANKTVSWLRITHKLNKEWIKAENCSQRKINLVIILMSTALCFRIIDRAGRQPELNQITPIYYTNQTAETCLIHRIPSKVILTIQDKGLERELNSKPWIMKINNLWQQVESTSRTKPRETLTSTSNRLTIRFIRWSWARALTTPSYKHHKCSSNSPRVLCRGAN